MENICWICLTLLEAKTIATFIRKVIKIIFRIKLKENVYCIADLLHLTDVQFLSIKHSESKLWFQSSPFELHLNSWTNKHNVSETELTNWGLFGSSLLLICLVYLAAMRIGTNQSAESLITFVQCFWKHSFDFYFHESSMFSPMFVLYTKKVFFKHGTKEIESYFRYLHLRENKALHLVNPKVWSDIFFLLLYLYKQLCLFQRICFWRNDY